MTRALVLHPEAADEFKEAARWYASRKKGLGVAFAMAVDEALMSIAQHHHRYPKISTNRPWRRIGLRGFPYVVFYEVEGDRVLVMAIVHGRRRPGYWVARQKE